MMSTKPADKSTIKFGMKGDCVKELQESLIACGYSCGATGADGDFGTNTLNAVKSFQKANNLSVDGIVGPKTWEAIEAKLNNASSIPTGVISTGSVADEKNIWDFLISKIGNPYGAAGLMGNLYAESGLRSNNLEGVYETKLGYTDQSYTAAVDNGTYTNFIKDSAGYGLAQWTYWSRKQDLLNYAHSKSKSIGDINMQLEFLYKELNESYPSVLKKLKSSKSVQEASNTVLLDFERPANQSIENQEKRAGFGKKYYDKYAISNPAPAPATNPTETKMKYSSTNKPLECMMTQSTCYKGTKKMKVLGVLWHSTGANNPTLKRYVQPDDNAKNKAELLKKIGTNSNHNDWNHIDRRAGLNAWIGKFADGSIGTIQTMPWDYGPWGCGNGSKGSCNNGWIQFEICEDDLTNKEYFEKVYEEAAQLTAYLCKMYNIDPNDTVTINGTKIPTILCHADSHKLGFGSNHGDVDNWFPKFGKSMATARQRVAEILNNSTQLDIPVQSTPTIPTPNTQIEVGDLVSIAENAVYSNGASIPDWVKKQKWYVYSVNSNGRIIINYNENKTKAIMSPIDEKYLTIVSNETFQPYKIRVTAAQLNYRAGAGVENKVNGTITDKGIYTIVAEAPDSTGYMWGKLKSGVGWISLKYTEKI